MEVLAPTSELGVLFCDVAGSMKLYETFGDTLAKVLIDECLLRVGDVARECNGWVIKTIGDEVMCAFREPNDTFAAAMAMQEKVYALPPIEGVKRMVRIGFHFGPVLEMPTDVFGDTVNVAARLTEIAQGNQIITSKATVLRMPPMLRTAARDIAAMVVKSTLNGANDDLAVAEVMWHAGDDLTMTTPSFVHARATTLALSFGTQSLHLDGQTANTTGAYFGRDPRCEFVLQNSKVSRMHAKIERRRGQFYLIDQSTNGTVVAFAGESEVSLRREETMLRGSGQILCGATAPGDLREPIHFAVRG